VREALAAAGLLAPLEALPAAAGGGVRLHVTVPSTEDAPALLRALLPTYPDMASAFAALNEAAAVATAAAAGAGAGAGTAVAVTVAVSTT
jgi:hypothetical protein